MEKIVECVPNFSEGRDMAVIKGITEEITAVDGVMLLDVDPGKDTNRTVVTFVGEPPGVVEAAFRAIKKAALLIDMSKHQGTHPRMGATDVCPLIPVSGITLEECVELAKRLSRRVGEELGIPVYLYGYAALRADRRKLPDIRQGEYEALPEKMKDPGFKPDYGPARFNAKSGATVIGSRNFLLAYNINLNSKDPKLAREIGMNIRESGRAKRDKTGAIIRDTTGKAVKIPGKLKECQATGWYIAEYGRAQVTMNLHDYKVTGLHTAFETVCQEAKKLGLRVTGSELIGMAPKEAILEAGRYYLKKQGKSRALPEEEIIHTAILSLGLRDITPFKSTEKIIEYKISHKNGGLADLNLGELVNQLSLDSPAPGGGSVAALCGALSAALSSMVASLTFGKKGFAGRKKLMEETGLKAQSLKTRYLKLMDLDSAAFNSYMAAFRLARKTTEERVIRDTAIQKAAKNMTSVPLQTLRLARELLELSETCTRKGIPAAITDGAVGAIAAEAAAEGAYLNIRVNLPAVADKQFSENSLNEADEILKQVKKLKKRIVTTVYKNL